MWYCMIISVEQTEIKIKPRIKLNYTIYTSVAVLGNVLLHSRSFNPWPNGDVGHHKFGNANLAIC